MRGELDMSQMWHGPDRHHILRTIEALFASAREDRWQTLAG